jgi:hypothetical protein
MYYRPLVPRTRPLLSYLSFFLRIYTFEECGLLLAAVANFAFLMISQMSLGVYKKFVDVAGPTKTDPLVSENKYT